MQALVAALNSLTPLGLAGGLAYVIYLLVRNRQRIETIETNHLHGLPEMAATLDRIEDLLGKVNDNLIYVRARINGK